MREKYEIWLNQKNLEKSSKKYLGGVNTISNFAQKLKIINKNLFDIVDTQEFATVKEKIFNNEEFKKKKKKGHYMYSAALNNYQEFLNERESEFEEIKEENEQFEKINNGSITGYNTNELNKLESQKYEYKPKIEVGKKRVLREKTDPKLKATRIELSNYNCEINEEHKTFTNATGEHQYLECHHIIPISAQKDFPNTKLDSMFNLIAVCPICHAKVHYANTKEKGEIFSKMYELRKNEMQKHGFDLNEINEVFNKYYK